MNRTATTALGSLAGLAVMTLAGPAVAAPVDPVSAGAGGAPCGTPAVPAVLETVVHPAVFETVEHAAVFETVPAVTHLEWRWSRSEVVSEVRYQRTVTQQLVEWKRDAGVVESEWVRQVLESVGAPGRDAAAEVGHWETRVVSAAAYVTEYEFIHPNEPNGNANPNAGSGQEVLVHWSTDPGWNAERNPNSIGWIHSGETREVEQAPAVTEQVWVVDVEAQDAIAPVAPIYTTQSEWSSTRPAGQGWARTGAEKTVVISGVEQQLLPQGETPDEQGWDRTGRLFDGSTHTENLWAETHPGGDWVATGQQRPGRTVTETTPGHSATAPGQGWDKVDGSEVTVIDEAETKIQVKDAWTEPKMVKGPWDEQVTVSETVPAGPECPVEENPETEAPTTPIVLGEEQVVEQGDESDDGRPGTTPIVLGVEATADTTRTPVAVPTSVDAGLAGTVATPAVGTDWRQAAGLFAVAAGLVLYTVPARRATSR